MAPTLMVSAELFPPAEHPTSIAAIIALACDEVSISKNDLMMLHNCWTFSVGNKEQLQNAVRQVTGQTYPMALRRKQQVKSPENDPLSQLLTAGRGMGVAVNEKE